MITFKTKNSTGKQMSMEIAWVYALMLAILKLLGFGLTWWVVLFPIWFPFVVMFFAALAISFKRGFLNE